MQQTDKSPLSKHRETQRKKAGRRRVEEEHRECRSSKVGLNKAWATLFQSVLKQQGEDDTPAYTSQWHAPKFQKAEKVFWQGKYFIVCEAATHKMEEMETKAMISISGRGDGNRHT